MPENVDLQVVPDSPRPEPRRYFSRASLEAALEHEYSAPDVDLSSDRIYLLSYAMRQPEAVAVEEFTNEFDLLGRYWVDDRDACLRNGSNEKKSSGPVRRRRRGSPSVRTENAEPIEPVEAEWDRPLRPGEVKPGVFTGEPARKLRERAHKRLERDGLREAKKAADAEAADNPDQDRSGTFAATPEPDQDIPEDGHETEGSPLPRKKRGWAVPDAVFIQVEAREVLKRRDLSAGAKLLYGFLENWSRSWGWKPVDATQAAMAEALGVTRHTIGRWAEELTDKGLIEYQRRYARNPGKYKVMPIQSGKS